MEKGIDKSRVVLVCLSPAIDVVNGVKTAGGKAVNIAKILCNFGLSLPTLTVL